MAFRWRADDDPVIVILQTKERKKKSFKNEDPSDKTFWIRACTLTA